MATSRPDSPLTNAPVNLVFGGIHFQPEPAWGEGAVGEIRKTLKDTYPHWHKLNEVQADVRKSPDAGEIKVETRQIENKIFTNLDRTSGFILNDRFLGFIETRYVGFGQFKQKFENVLLEVQRLLDLTLYLRLGIRYVDVILPSSGNTFADYMERELLPFETSSVEGVSLISGQSSSEYETHEGRLLLRSRIADNPIGIAPDLVALAEYFDFKYRDIEGKAAIMDTDHFCMFQPGVPLRTEEVWERLDRLHVTAGDMFFKAVTDTAIKEWA